MIWLKRLLIKYIRINTAHSVAVRDTDIVESYWVKTYKSGIVHLLINTKSKWIHFHRSSNTTYVLEDIHHSDAYYLEIGCLQYLDEYIALEYQEKDQISFYYVPLELVSKGKIRKLRINKRWRNYKYDNRY